MDLSRGVTDLNIYNLSRPYLRKRSTSDIGVLVVSI